MRIRMSCPEPTRSLRGAYAEPTRSLCEPTQVYAAAEMGHSRVPDFPIVGRSPSQAPWAYAEPMRDPRTFSKPMGPAQASAAWEPTRSLRGCGNTDFDQITPIHPESMRAYANAVCRCCVVAVVDSTREIEHSSKKCICLGNSNFL